MNDVLPALISLCAGAAMAGLYLILLKLAVTRTIARARSGSGAVGTFALTYLLRMLGVCGFFLAVGLLSGTLGLAAAAAGFLATRLVVVARERRVQTAQATAAISGPGPDRSNGEDSS